MAKKKNKSYDQKQQQQKNSESRVILDKLKNQNKAVLR